MSCNILNLKQGSELWHKTRLEHYKTASRTPIVCGVSPFQSKEQLAMQLRGEYEPFYSKAMQMGNEFEDDVRTLAEMKFNDTFKPLVGIKDDYLASLDGINFSRDTIIEIKVSEKTFNDLKDGIIPDVYYFQIQHQMMVFDEVDQAYLVAYNPKTCETAYSKPILPDMEAILFIKESWKRFDEEKDTLKVEEFDMSENDEFLMAVDNYKLHMKELEEAKEKAEDAKKALLEFYQGGKTFGGGVTISYTKPSKSVNYSQLYKDNKALLKDVDLSKYEGERKGSFRVSVK
ncbi:lambda-exonuclease family protein [Arcobacter arenosus]|uniref:YqaJ viral recombinase domain-containing protein n=1 Tax=Arcobacter arenosus TaxID=2576037 RepID=A0A5R8Y4L2_9BACT|nr:YqaJ viral recombinase family protein [Arcobacter arenosus]TLP41067.1 hypothetical protein FDK22_03335 [Arcobacter arenosus]